MATMFLGTGTCLGFGQARELCEYHRTLSKSTALHRGGTTQSQNTVLLGPFNPLILVGGQRKLAGAFCPPPIEIRDHSEHVESP